MSLLIDREDPRTPDVVALLEQHLVLMRSTTEPEHVFALDVDSLCHPDIDFYAARDAGRLLGVGALKRLDPTHGEVKSMHTAASARGRGVGAAILERLLAGAATSGLQRVSLETGAGDAFGAAHRLYRRAGFVDCGPFGDYEALPTSRFMTRTLTRPA